MEPKQIRAFPHDFTQWIVGTVAEDDVGKEVLRLWDHEIVMLEDIVKFLNHPIDFEWSFGLTEYGGEVKHIGYRLFVKIVNLTPPVEVTYFFRLDESRHIVEMRKFSGEVAVNGRVNVQ